MFLKKLNLVKVGAFAWCSVKIHFRCPVWKKNSW